MLEKLGVLVVGNLNVMTLICLALAAMCLGVVIIVLVSKMLSSYFQPRKSLREEKMTAPTYKCACTSLCSTRVDRLGGLCQGCDNFGCRRI